MPRSDVAPRYREYLRLWNDARHAGKPNIGYWVLVYVDETDAKAVAKAKPYFEYCFTRVFGTRADGGIGYLRLAENHAKRGNPGGAEIARHAIDVDYLREHNLAFVGSPQTVIEQIKAAAVPVILHPTMFRSTGEKENLSMETAAKLHEAGIPIALQSSFESYVPKTRVVLFEAAIAASNGLKFEDALATITIDAAKILGIEKRVGSIEVGKDADVALYDGDPFEYTSHCVGTIIDGRVVSNDAH